ncbi:hypothetical protein A1O1_00824 [Capronia coronata CBS 617.96]|uniref:NAD(P)-binding protein n=1 Tax=Capronia coronata CBS 617.96 TaxID=1182541 RepID=W9Z296_9EURO|nr:uncharacterized protein A1O1_00824 [Capronia coronata CBS 617.96]EXJ95701.1 hypothetical protein A1O1_00824 [Capronia coronata CBS 617.96]
MTTKSMTSTRVAATAVKALKILFALGMATQVNRFLNRLALNYWHLRRQGKPWEFQTEGKETIVVTGGCSGFGKAMVDMFAAKTKANLVVLDVQQLPDDMKNIPRLSYFQTDLTSPTSITATTTSLLESIHPAPTVLINNAGIAQAHTILGTSDAFLEKIFRVNVLSHFTLIRLLLPHMLAMRKGHIVSLASMASFTGVAGLADYSASKAAVLGLHESLVQELGHRYGGDEGVKGGVTNTASTSASASASASTSSGTTTSTLPPAPPPPTITTPPTTIDPGHTIQASIIHPMWARTPLINTWESALDGSGQPVLTAQDVARRVVDQVLSGRSGSVYIPEKMWTGTLLRVLPEWVAIWIRGGVQNATATAMGASSTMGATDM